MRQVSKLAGWLVNGLAAFGVAAFGAAAVVTVADVVGRRFGYPIEGVVDLVQLFVVTGAWLTMPFAFFTAGHVSVDFLLSVMPGPLMIPLKVLAAVGSFVLVAQVSAVGHSNCLVLVSAADRFGGVPVGDRHGTRGIATTGAWL